MTDLTPLGPEAVSRPKFPAVRPAGFVSVGTDDRALLQLAARILSDPLAVQRLGDRVVELLHQDLKLQQERRGRY